MLPVPWKNLESPKCHFCCIELYETTVKPVIQLHCSILKQFQCSLEKSKVHETFSKCGKPRWLRFMVFQGFCKIMHANDVHLFFCISYTVPFECSLHCTKEIVIGNEQLQHNVSGVNNVSKAFQLLAICNQFVQLSYLFLFN